MRIFDDKRALVLIGIVICMLTALSCGGGNKPAVFEPAARTVSDDLGRAIKLPEKIERVVSLAPSVTEMIFAAGAGDRLVGVTSFCDYPEAAKAIEKIGDTQTPNIERILALKPDVVFVSTASQLETFFRTLEQRNIAVYVVDPKGIGGITENLRRLGELFGTSKLAESAANELEERTRAIADGVKGSARPRVFLQISNEPLFTIGKGAFMAELIETAGGELVTRDVPSAFPKLSKETASAMNPDVIILSDSDDNREPNVVFRNSPALKNGRVYRINPDIISRPGPRLVDALEQIAGFLHKEVEK